MKKAPIKNDVIVNQFFALRHILRIWFSAASFFTFLNSSIN